MEPFLPPALAALIGELCRLPGIGKKTATRLALHLLRRPAGEAARLAAAIKNLHAGIRLCSICFAFSDDDPCSICADSRRDERLVCVVEGMADMLAIEKSGAYRGRYHVLHGVLSPLDGIGPGELNIRPLVRRITEGGVREVLIATSSTVPGEATAAFLCQQLESLPVTISRLAHGIPMGMDIQYADEMTLAAAIETRRNVRTGSADPDDGAPR